MENQSVYKKHFKFKGIDLDGNPQDFYGKLINMGFQLVGENTLVGKFANDNVKLFVFYTPISKVVYEVFVSIPNLRWMSAKTSYFNLKDLLKRKYGDCFSIEEFEYPYSDGCGYELAALKEGLCRYLTIFDMQLGSIKLNICSSEENAAVVLIYTDKENEMINNNERDLSALDDL